MRPQRLASHSPNRALPRSSATCEARPAPTRTTLRRGAPQMHARAQALDRSRSPPRHAAQVLRARC